MRREFAPRNHKVVEGLNRLLPTSDQGRVQAAPRQPMQRAEKHSEPVILGTDPMELLLLSIMLGHEKEIIELRKRSKG